MVLFGGGFRYGAAYFNAKEGMAMKEFWSLVQLGFAAVGGWLRAFSRFFLTFFMLGYILYLPNYTKTIK